MKLRLLSNILDGTAYVHSSVSPSRSFSVHSNVANQEWFLVGNEADHYAGGSRPSGWASSDYTAQFLVSSTTQLLLK